MQALLTSIAALLVVTSAQADTIHTLTFTAVTTYFDPVAAPNGNYYGVTSVGETFQGVFDVTTLLRPGDTAFSFWVYSVNAMGCGNCFNAAGVPYTPGDTLVGYVNGTMGSVPDNRIGSFDATFDSTGQLIRFDTGGGYGLDAGVNWAPQSGIATWGQVSGTGFEVSGGYITDVAFDGVVLDPEPATWLPLALVVLLSPPFWRSLPGPARGLPR